MYYLEKDMTEALRTFTLGLETLKNYEVLRAQFNNVLDLLLPGDGNDLLPLHGQDWPALKDEVIMWMEGQVYDRRLRQTFGSGAGRVDVEAEHLLDDYWWVTATRPGPTRMTPPWRWSGSGTVKTACATGRATRPASPNRTEGEPLGTTDRSRWLPRPGGR